MPYASKTRYINQRMTWPGPAERMRGIRACAVSPKRTPTTTQSNACSVLPFRQQEQGKHSRRPALPVEPHANLNRPKQRTTAQGVTPGNGQRPW